MPHSRGYCCCPAEALVLEAGQAVEAWLAARGAEEQHQQQQPGAGAACSGGTPCSVLQFLPPSPPRPNPILAALRCPPTGGSSMQRPLWGAADPAGESWGACSHGCAYSCELWGQERWQASAAVQAGSA